MNVLRWGQAAALTHPAGRHPLGQGAASCTLPPTLGTGCFFFWGAAWGATAISCCVEQCPGSVGSVGTYPGGVQTAFCNAVSGEIRARGCICRLCTSQQAEYLQAGALHQLKTHQGARAGPKPSLCVPMAPTPAEVMLAAAEKLCWVPQSPSRQWEGSLCWQMPGSGP